MTKGIIQIHLINGTTLSYVRDVVTDTNGKNKEYYGWDEATELLNDQDDVAGKILHDHASLITSLSSAVTAMLQFPESTPSTVLSRFNQNSTLDKTEDVVQITIPKSSVNYISIRTSQQEDYGTFLTRAEA